MAVVLRRGTSTQPPATPSVAWEHPITRDLLWYVHYLEGGGLPQELVSGRSVSPTGINWEYTVHGLARQSDGNAASTDVVSVLPVPRNRYSLWALFVLSATGSYQNAIDDDNYSAGNEFRRYQFRVTDGNKPELIVFNTDAAPFFATGATSLVAGVPYQMAGVVGEDQVARVYLNGIQDGSGAASGTVRAPTASADLFHNKTGVQPMTGWLFAAAGWNRPLLHSELLELRVNPFLMLAPAAPRLRYFVQGAAAPSGGFRSRIAGGLVVAA